MELRIYNGSEIEKTYKAETYDLMFGTVEDIANAIHLDDLKGSTDTELLVFVTKFAMKSMSTIKNLLKDIFVGLTDEELKRTKVKDVARVLIEVINFTFGQLSGSEKN